ncbi:DUF3859 domain-containing protein [Desulfobotulus sp.]|uniref:DUF3859 domain-containing protein n=1 Tax=Desulfobotulus sp. TaxID=1940337 RepID=UPI002A368548|nr:DUF3859 domain-containing protein [Desulfobotulus sp.]MDY0163258.1 DUF3859 domain-containing protein [Desulfobotulus sp.]
MNQIHKALLIAFLTIATPWNVLGAEKSLRITEYGLFRVEITETITNPSKITGHQNNIRHVLLKTTDRIPLQRGANFGVSVVVDGSEDSREWTLRRVIRFPYPGLRDPKTGKTHPYDERLVTVQPGTDGTVSFTFDHEWEMVPGRWAIEFWDGEKKIAEKVFTVTTY